MFLSKKEIELAEKFKSQGFVVFKTSNTVKLDYLRKKFLKITNKILNTNYIDPNFFFNNFHKIIKKKDINDIRLKIISEINSISDLRKVYYEISKEFLHLIVGNELAMQIKINLSIQMPKDQTSTLDIHSDTWSGDSPFEVVVWIPMVDCYKTKTMYILPVKESLKVHKNFDKFSKKTSKDLFLSIKNRVKWINIKYGEILIFNQNLPHGNIVNNEKETRWSLNCRFKSIFSPYGDKKLGEFFQPITLKPATEIGFKYKYPLIKR